MNESRRLRSRMVLPVISFITFLGFLDTTLLIPILALYADELNATVGTIGIIIGLYSITNTPANILFGRLIDRVGYKLPLIAGLIGDALSMFFYSLCRIPLHLALVRIFHGISGAVVGPATMSVIADYSENTKKGRAMGFYGMAMAAANLIGFGVSGVVGSRLGYDVLFFMGAGLLVVGVILGFLLPGKPRKSSAVARSSHDDTFSKLKDLVKRRGLIVSYSSIFAQYFTFGGVVTLLPFHVENLGMDAFHVGMMLATFAVAFIIVQFPSGVICDKFGRLIPTAAGLALAIVSLLILPSMNTFLTLALAMGLYGIAFGIIFPSISALVSDNSLPEERGMATGVFHALLTSGVAIGAPVMGWLGGLAGIQSGLMLTPVVMVVALVVVSITLRR